MSADESEIRFAIPVSDDPWLSPAAVLPIWAWTRVAEMREIYRVSRWPLPASPGRVLGARLVEMAPLTDGDATRDVLCGVSWSYEVRVEVPGHAPTIWVLWPEDHDWWPPSVRLLPVNERCGCDG